jgi:dTDP-4-amino-4,6-dideoxygalactose transaminase
MIRMNAFDREPEELIGAQLQAFERVVRSGWYILGKEVEAFEQQWATVCGVAHAVGVANGMDALEIGLRVLDIGPGDEVVTTGMTAFATILAILRAGATPVLADIDPTTGLLDAASVARCITPRTKAVLLVHLYGQMRNLAQWRSFCQVHALHLLEDAAQAHLASEGGTRAGAFGTWGAYSFYPTKNLGALGDAGALVTNAPALATRARVLRNYGQSERYHHPVAGLNSRLDEVQAAILGARLPHLEAFTARRRAIAHQYVLGMKNPCVQLLVPPLAPENHVYHLFAVRCRERQGLISWLRQHEVESFIHYPVPAHQQEPCRSVPRDPRGLPHTEAFAADCLSLPCHPQMSDNDVAQVIATVNRFR